MYHPVCFKYCLCGGPMVELSKKEYRELAYEYLHEASKAALRIKSLKRNIQRIKNDITSLRAVNYGKERVDGGEPSGIEDDINRLLDMEMRYKRQRKICDIKDMKTSNP